MKDSAVVCEDIFPDIRKMESPHDQTQEKYTTANALKEDSVLNSLHFDCQTEKYKNPFQMFQFLNMRKTTIAATSQSKKGAVE